MKIVLGITLAVSLVMGFGSSVSAAPVAPAPAPEPAPAAAAAPAPTTTTLTGPAQFTLRVPVTVTARVTGAGEPAATGVIRFEQQTPAGWAVIGDGVVNAAGQAEVAATFASTPVTLRATYLGTPAHEPSTSAPVVITGVPQATSIVLDAPRSVVDERSLQLAALVRTPSTTVAGAAVSFQVFEDRKWRTFASARTDGAGIARAAHRPRKTSRYRAVVAAADWYSSATSATVTVKNVAPGAVIKLPKKAPTPKKLPAQPRASGDGAHPTVSRISDAVWRSMKGRSWRAGCPVGRSQLRLVRVNYWGFDGYRHRGELVVHRSITGKTTRAFADLYRHEVPIRAMYRPDRFGYSKRLRGANDYRSMAHDNTSAFNCRNVVGRAGVRSPHATGRSIDINPFENPYRYRAGKWVPNTWWNSRSAGTYAWTKKSHLVPTIMRRHGFRWTFGRIDGQHFDG